MKSILFKESQKNILIIAIVPAVLTSLLFGLMAIAQIVFHKPIGNHPAPSSMLVSICVLSIIGIIVFSKQKLEMKITQDEIQLSFGLFAAPKTIQIQDVKNARVREYDAISEFLGWGVKFNNKENDYPVVVTKL
jgi:hypothetical protein